MVDRSYNQLLNELRDYCIESRDLSTVRKILAVAADHRDTVAEALEYLSLEYLTDYTLIMNPMVEAPSLVGRLVVALSASRPQEVERLFYQWLQVPLQGNIRIDDPYIYIAVLEGAGFIRAKEESNKQDNINGNSTPWSWHEKNNMTDLEAYRYEQLVYRAMMEKEISLKDIMNVKAHLSSLIIGLRYQDVIIHPDIFCYFAEKMIEIDSYSEIGAYTTSILIELSRKTNFDQSIWLKELLKIIATKGIKKELDYVVYSLLNTGWHPPAILSIENVVEQYYR